MSEKNLSVDPIPYHRPAKTPRIAYNRADRRSDKGRYGQRHLGQRRAGPASCGALVSYFENHDELAGYYDAVLETVADPDLIVPGYRGSLAAVRNYGRRRYLYVIYREVTSDDGFIVTAYFSSKVDRKKAVWKRP